MSVPLDFSLHEVNGKRVADDSSFDGSTGLIHENKDCFAIDKGYAQRLMQAFSGINGASDFNISDITSKSYSRKTPSPFITSTLQRASSSKLGLSVSDTMRVAQQLYEEGFITYMRTDSPSLSTTAFTIAAQTVKDMFGTEYLAQFTKESSEANKRKAPINAQEAHEAIRPAEYDGRFKTPEESGLDGKKKDLYTLIYNRTLASVMNNAEFESHTFTIVGKNHHQQSEFQSVVFRASYNSVKFPGFLKASKEYSNNSDVSPTIAIKTLINKGSGQPIYLDMVRGESVIETHRTRPSEADDHDDACDTYSSSFEDRFAVLKACDNDLNTNFALGGLACKQHSTRPPHRFSESTFIKELEKMGVGRPSTYASVIEKLCSEQRGYIRIDKGSLIPTVTGMVVDNFLNDYFPEITQSEFTAKMEESLDLISSGESDKLTFLTTFYLGLNKDGFMYKAKKLIESKQIDPKKSRTLLIPFLDDIGEFRISSSGAFFESLESATAAGSSLLRENVLRTEQNQSTVLLSSTSFRRWKLPQAMQHDLREVSRKSILSLMEAEIPLSGFFLGLDSSGQAVTARSGKFGKYLQVNTAYFSLPKWITKSSTLEQVLEFASLPRVLGRHPDSAMSDANVIVDLSNGEVSVGVQGYPIRVKLPTVGVYPSEVSFDDALKILPDCNVILGSRRQIGIVNNEPMTLEKARFGFYLRCGNLITGLRKHNPDELTYEQALYLLNTYGKPIGTGKKRDSKVSVKASKAAKIEQKKTSKRHQNEDAVKVKRVPGPFIVFCAENRTEIRNQNPNADFGKIAKILAEMWSKLSSHEKEAFRMKPSINSSEGHISDNNLK